MRRVGPSVQEWPMFWLVFETTPGVWDVRCYMSVGSANNRAAKLKATGRLAFVEAR